MFRSDFNPKAKVFVLLAVLSVAACGCPRVKPQPLPVGTVPPEKAAMFKSDFDPIGFNPTQNQAEFGTPRVSGYGLAQRATATQAGLDYYPTWPYRGMLNFTGAQFFASARNESLYAETFLYRGVAPLALQPLINKPYPYQVGARRQRGVGK